MLSIFQKIKSWLNQIEEYDKQAKKMRREDRAGNVDYEQVQKEFEEKEYERENSKLDA